jgi:hypothetical protein
MEALRDSAPYVALAAAALGLVLFVLVLVLWSRMRQLRRAQVVVMGHHEQRDIVGHVESLDSQVRNLREAVEILTDQLDEQKRHLDHALTNRAILRYDAFRDAGGEQSASFALLDQYRSGVVFSAIAARDFARIYVKHLSEGVADRDLSPEEERVVAAAVPRPLGAGEEGPRAARAPKLPEEPAPAAVAGRPQPSQGGEATTAAPRSTPDAAAPAGAREAAPAAHDTAEFPADEPAAPALEPEVTPAAGRHPLDDTADFTWEPPPPRRRPDEPPTGD